MPLPDRPVSHAAIESVWGQTIHDYTFAPTGFDLDTATTRTVNDTAGGQKCHLDTVNQDPAGFLDAGNDQAEVPTGGEGLYILHVSLNSVSGTAGDETRVFIYVNGVAKATGLEDNAGGTNVTVTAFTIEELSAGDILTIFAQKKGSGTNPTVHVTSFKGVRIGAEFGA
jgi:hypothetical protein